MGDQIADEPAGRLELLPHLGGRRIDQVVAEKIAVGPVASVTGQTQSVQTAFHYRVRGRRALNGFQHGCTQLEARKMECQLIPPCVFANRLQ